MIAPAAMDDAASLPLLHRVAARVGHLAARWRGEWLALRLRLGGGRCGARLWVGRGVVLKYPPHAGLQWGDDLRLGEYSIIDVPPGGRLCIGDRVTMSMGCVCAARAQVAIGEDCLVGEYTSIRDADHGLATDRPMRAQPLVSTPVRIDADVWIGRGCAVLRGAVIGAHAVVAANSVVRGEVPSWAVVAGAPAVVRKWRRHVG